MKKNINIMRLGNPIMVSGLVDLCDDLKEVFKERELVVVEVGSYIGESTQILLNHLPIKEIHCVDKWGVTDKYDEHEISRAEQVFLLMHGKNEKVRIYKTDSRDEKLRSIRPDVVYIDASHRYEDVAADIDFWRKIVKRGGVICGHDYAPKFSGVVRAVDERFSNVKIYADTSWSVDVW